jgi:hypothetical protein
VNALNEAAKEVERSWCKENLYQYDHNEGDQYCALGALMKSMPLIEQKVDWNYNVVGTPEEIAAYYRLMEVWKDNEYMGFPDLIGTGAVDIYDYLRNRLEGRLLAEVILANFPDRFETEWMKDKVDFWIENELWDKIIVNFNDHEDTTREEVIAMMEKAGAKFEELVEFEDEQIDELVEEVKELINA